MISTSSHENLLHVSPALATQLGLEEATMLAILKDLLHYRDTIAHKGLQWLELKEDILQKTMPFWRDTDIQRICKSLHEQGLLVLGSAPYTSSRVVQFALTASHKTFSSLQNPPSHNNPDNKTQSHQSSQTKQLPIVNTSPARTGSACQISPYWQPSDDAMRQLAQYTIPEPFLREQIGLFVIYWRERGDLKHSWDTDFIKHALREWRYHEIDNNRQQRQEQQRQQRWDQERFIQTEQEGPMRPGWNPSQDALEVLLKHAAISASFVEDAIPEFIIYWQEKGTVANTWNTKFIQHVRRQWARYSSTVEHNSEAKLLSAHWQPSADAFDVLKLANIDLDFARQQLPEFILYWRDRKEIHNAWNSKFMQHCKYHWARRHHLETPATSTTHSQAASGNTRNRSLSDDLSDRSWAV